MTTSWYVGFTLIVTTLGAIIGYSICALLFISSENEEIEQAYNTGYKHGENNAKRANFITIDKE